MTLALDKIVNSLRGLGSEDMWMGDGGNSWLVREGVGVLREEEQVDEEIIGVMYRWGGEVNWLVTLGLKAFKSILMVVNPLTDGICEVLEAKMTWKLACGLHCTFKAVKQVLIGGGEVDKELVGERCLIKISVLDSLVDCILFKGFEVFMQWLLVLSWSSDGSGGVTTLGMHQLDNVPKSLVSVPILKCHIKSNTAHHRVNDGLGLK